MLIAFEKMTSEEFEVYREKLIETYTQDNIKSGKYDAETALENSRKEVYTILQNGLHTEGHELLRIVDRSNGEKVGYLWINDLRSKRRSKVFIYDLIIFEEFRGKGYGKASLNALEQFVRELGVMSISLHVFAHNEVALALYKSLGYTITNINMTKTFE
jgi:RimJ/RimL family protein N-acetyltransferase